MQKLNMNSHDIFLTTEVHIATKIFNILKIFQA